MISHLIVIVFIFIIAFVAYLIQSLSTSGAIAAVVVGITIYLGFEIKGLIIMGIFFGSSNLWSLYKSQQKKKFEEKLEKGSQRDWIQVFANGGIAGVCSILYYLTNDIIWGMAFITSIASATGDTWSSEIGPLSKRSPLSVKSFKVVEVGTSGAVSILGTVSAICGVLCITLFGLLLWSFTLAQAWVIFVFGILGNGIDTYLGAYFQRTFQCVTCSLETEKQFHCGKKARKISGTTLLNNDGVNFLSSFLAPLLAMIIYQFLL
jgi:uncharacterized protein (TIGR00297 family)